MRELRDGFLVTDRRKRLWNIEIEILQDIQKVCQKNDIQYFLIYGAALGAVRHKGFIPWDDDIDIGMLRSDFDRFVSAYSANGNKKYCFQYGCSRKGEESTFLRIRSRNSTAIIRSQKSKNCTHGVFVEVYPYDQIPDNKILRILQLKTCTVLKLLLDERFNGVYVKSSLISLIRFLSKPFSNQAIWNIWHHFCSKYNGSNNKYISTPAMPNYQKEGDIYLRSDFNGVINESFESINVSIPVGFENMLKQNYGDYMQLPPVEERGKYHERIVFFDPDKPYTDYFGSQIVDDYFSGKVENDL